LWGSDIIGLNRETDIGSENRANQLVECVEQKMKSIDLNSNIRVILEKVLNSIS
jgi:hypothetical protein